MYKLDKHRILYEGMIDFYSEDRMINFQESIEDIFNKISFPVYIENDGHSTLVFHCMVNVDRKSHSIDEKIKKLLNKYKGYNDIGAMRIDKHYITQPIILAAYLAGIT